MKNKTIKKIPESVCSADLTREREFACEFGVVRLSVYLLLWVVDLSPLSVRRHTSLTGHLVGSHLKSDDISSFLQLLFVKASWVRVSLFWTKSRSSKALLLRLSAKSNNGRESLSDEREDIV